MSRQKHPWPSGSLEDGGKDGNRDSGGRGEAWCPGPGHNINMAETQLAESQSDTVVLETQPDVPETQPDVPETQLFDAEAQRLENLKKEYRFQDPEVQELLDIIISNGCDRNKWLDPVVTRILADAGLVVIKGDQTFDNWSVKFPVKDGELLKDVLIKWAKIKMDRYMPALFEHFGLFQLEMLVRNVLQIHVIVTADCTADCTQHLDKLVSKVRAAGLEFDAARNRMMEDKMTQDVANRKRKREEACVGCDEASNPDS